MTLLNKKILVKKFGGTSVQNLKCLEHCAEIILKSVEKNHKVVAVVSAMGSQTDYLSDLAKSISKNVSSRELDMLLTTGERVTSSLLSICLHKLGLTSISLTGSQCGILTDHIHGNAKIIGIEPQRLYESLEKNDVVIVAGFQGVCKKTKDVTTLGRGGSDLTAVAISSFLKADFCEIYTDVSGVLTADPKKVRGTRTISKLSWDQMSVLASQGAKVLHHKSADLAKKNKQKIIIKNTFDPHGEGSIISSDGESAFETTKVLAISSKSDQALCRLRGAGSVSFPLCSVLEWLWKNDERPSLCCQYRSRRDNIELLISEKKYKNLCAYLGQEFEADIIYSSIGVMSIIGYGLQNGSEVVTKILGCLNSKPLFLNISDTFCILAISMEDLDQSLGLLHENLL